MTPRQCEVLTFIRSFWASRGMGPTFAEVAEGVGSKSKGGMAYTISKLVESGALAHRPGANRDLRPTGRCPCCGRAD